MRTPKTLKSLAAVVLFVACGGKSPPPSTTASSSTTSDAPSSSASASPAISNAAPPATSASAAPASSADDDPNESAAPIMMSVELAKPFAKGTFPKAQADERSCWRTMSLSGDAKKDYDALAAKCGTPTGLAEYAKPVVGHLHHIKDKRDTFSLKLVKGLCYRYFAVADSGIADLDILVEKPGGALIADDKQNGPVAIIESDKSWCMDEDAQYDFHIQIDGTGAGQYMFGVWARPKS